LTLADDDRAALQQTRTSKLPRVNMVPLGLLNEGETGEIIAVRGGIPCPDMEGSGSRTKDLGLRISKRVEMLNNGAGAVLVKVDESRIALDRAAAMRIVVEEVTR
jgi:ferrous iron transport protein A